MVVILTDTVKRISGDAVQNHFLETNQKLSRAIQSYFKNLMICLRNDGTQLWDRLDLVLIFFFQRTNVGNALFIVDATCLLVEITACFKGVF